MPTSDRPTREDQLGFEPYVKAIEELVRQADPSELPFAVGIYGAWGSGKTSFLQQLQDRLEGKVDDGAPLPTVWFDAWKYDRTYDLRSALIFRLLRQLREGADDDLKGKIGETLSIWSRVVFGMVRGTQLSASVGLIGVELPKIDDVLAEIQKVELQFHTSVDRFSAAFLDSVRAFLGKSGVEEGKKLVVFIDDLDRCLPQSVITILEGLKLFLDEAPCVFVLGVDKTVVERAVLAHYAPAALASGRDYLDKIIQHSLSIPVPKPERLSSVLEEAAGVRITEDVRRIFLVAAELNPRIYARLLGAWRMASHLAPQLGYPVADAKMEGLLALATAIRIRFLQLHELFGSRPDRVDVFFEACAHPPTGGSDWLIRSNSKEFQEAWEDPAIRRFGVRLDDKIAGESMRSFNPDQLSAAFRLAGQIGQ